MTADVIVRGWCPGALRPMPSGDGLIVRVRPRAGRFDTRAVAAIVELANRLGNGAVDLTRRGNLQIRGLVPSGLGEAQAMLAAHGLLDESPEGEAVRNVLLDPLAGLDPEARADMTDVARTLETRLARDPVFHRLPGKFGFAVDGGGRLPVAGEPVDIAVVATAADRAEIRVARPEGFAVVARVRMAEAADRAADGAAGLVSDLQPGRRLRDLAADRVAAAFGVGPADLEPVAPPRTMIALGGLGAGGQTYAFGAAAPFGRMTADELGILCDWVLAAGVGEMRVAPWRALYLPIGGVDCLRRVQAAAVAAGLLFDPTDPLLAVDACPGRPACPQGHVETRTVARRLAPALRGSGLRSLHVSGCAKGCARSTPADLVLVGEPGGSFGIVRSGTAQSPPIGAARAGEEHLALWEAVLDG